MRSGPGADAPAAPADAPDPSGAAPADGASAAPVPVVDPGHAPLFTLEDGEEGASTPAAAPPHGDGAAPRVDDLIDDGEPIDHEAARRESLDIRAGYALRLAAELAGALDAVLPLARALMAVATAHGGPAADRYVADPHGGPSARILPEILDAEVLLHRAASVLDLDGREPELGQAVEPLAGSSGLEGLPDDAFVDSEDPPAADPPPSGDPVLDAARRLVRADEAMRARSIAGLPPGAELLARRDAARSALSAVPDAATAATTYPT